MNKTKHMFKSKWYELCLLFIIVVSIFLRFYNYDQRLGLAYDQAHDAIVSLYALEQGKLPLLGPFSSAGAFQTGGEWYWFIMAGQSVFPYYVFTPWIVLTLCYVLFVFCISILAKKILGKVFSIIVGILAAISPAQIAHAINLTNQAPLAMVSLFVLWGALSYLKSGHRAYAFFLGLGIALGITIHTQGIGLLFLLPALFILRFPQKRNIGYFLLGFVIPFLPLLKVDLENNFFNMRGILDYYIHGQYAIYVPNRWLTYIGVFWPKTWARIIGGETLLGYLAMILLTITVIHAILKRDLNKSILMLIFSFTTMVFILRYYRGERFDSYFVFLHPYVLLLTGWMIYQLKKINIVISICILGIFILGSIKADYLDIKGATNYAYLRAFHWQELLSNTYKDKKFVLYDYQYRSTTYSFPLVLFLYTQNKLDKNGYKIGFGDPKRQYREALTPIKGNKVGFFLWDINNFSHAKTKKEEWSRIDPETIYQSTQEWYKRNDEES